MVSYTDCGSSYFKLLYIFWKQRVAIPCSQFVVIKVVDSVDANNLEQVQKEEANDCLGQPYLVIPFYSKYQMENGDGTRIYPPVAPSRLSHQDLRVFIGFQVHLPNPSIPRAKVCCFNAAFILCPLN